MAILWALMMTVWLGGLISGLWWIWPHIERLALTTDLIIGLMWLVIGAAAWVLALSFGVQRYFPTLGGGLRPPSDGRSRASEARSSLPPPGRGLRGRRPRSNGD